MKYLFKHINIFYSVLKREIQLLSKDFDIISILLLAPLFYSFFYGSIYWNKIETDVPITVVNIDNSELSQKLIRMLDAHQSIKIYDKNENLNSAKTELENGTVHGIILIPKDFERGIKKGNGAFIKSYLNTTRFLVSNDINKAVTDVVLQFNGEIKSKVFGAKGFTPQQVELISEPVKLDMRPMFNFTESYGDYMIPAILILIIQQTLLIGLSESVSKEIEENSLNNWYAQSGRKTFLAILGKGFFYFVLYSSYALMFFTINFFVFKINFLGSANALAVLTLVFIIAVVSWTIFISSFFKRKIIALQFLTLSSYPVFLISGYSWPMNSMPVWLQVISNMMPSTPYYAAFTRITQMGAQFHNVELELMQLIGLAVLGFTAAYFRIKFLFGKKINEAPMLN